MQTDQLIPAKVFCSYHQVELSFIQSLQDSGLIDLSVSEEDCFIHPDQIGQLERIVCLYREMDINIEGIEAITHLLQRINSLQQEITLLRNRLQLYETI